MTQKSDVSMLLIVKKREATVFWSVCVCVADLMFCFVSVVVLLLRCDLFDCHVFDCSADLTSKQHQIQKRHQQKDEYGGRFLQFTWRLQVYWPVP